MTDSSQIADPFTLYARPARTFIRIAAAAALTCASAMASDAQAQDAAPNDAASSRHEQLFVEGGFGLNEARSDAYTDRLKQFGFEPQDSEGDSSSLIGTASLGMMFTRHLGALLRYEGLEHRAYYRDLSGPSDASRDENFSWTTRAISLGLRFRAPLGTEYFSLYGEGDVGLGIGHTQMTGDDVDDSERFYGVVVGGRAGIQAHASNYFGFFLEGGFNYAPVIDNLVGDTHDDGGLVIATGIRVRTLGGSW